MGLILRVVAGQDAGRIFPITTAGAIIGRGERATIQLADTILSRQHARIALQGDGATLTDLDSANGTQVNGQPLRGAVMLRPGDIVEVGATRLRLEVGDGAGVVEERRAVPPDVRQQETIRRADEPTAPEPTAPVGGAVALGATLNGRYRLDSLAGKGGFAQVFVAFDLELHRSVALKVLHANLQEAEGGKDLLERFQREARAVAALNHGNILPIWDYGHVGGSPYLVMPFIDGGSLYDRLRSGPQPDLQQIGEWLRQVAAALDYAHARKIVHRDIKPQNMLLNTEEGRLLLADFGIAKVITEAGSQNATGVIGTLSYMAPEQLRGQVGKGVDVYALGCVLFQMLTGKLPYSGSTEQVIFGHLQGPVPPLIGAGTPSLPAPLQAVIERALAKLSDDRYPTAGALASAYKEAIDKPSIATEIVRQRDAHDDRTVVAQIDRTVLTTNDRTQLADQGQAHRGGSDRTVVADLRPLQNHQQVQNNRVAIDNTRGSSNGRSGGISRRALLLGGAASGVAALACVGGGFALVAASRGGGATPTVAQAAAIAPSSTPVPPTATVAAAVPTVTTAPPTATSVPPTATSIPPTATIAPTATSVPPTATATSLPPTPTLRPATGDEVLRAWVAVANPGKSAGFDPALNGFRITANTPGAYVQFAPSAASYANFELLVDCRVTETSGRGLYGVYVHASPTQSGTTVIGYRFFLTENGYWLLEYVNANSTVTTVKPYTVASGLNPATKANRLTVTSRNRALVLGINGTTVGTFEAVAPASGWIGLVASNYTGTTGVEAVFTDLRITKL